MTAVRPPLVAIVGRPNVGKSTLFNRLTGTRAALVDDQPGVTRDRIFGEAAHEGRLYRLVDTGGFDTDPDDTLIEQMRQQIQLAVDEAELVLVILDGADGVRPADREVVQMLRRSGKPLLGVVNKLDHESHADRLADFYGLGLDLVGISAEHDRGRGELWDAIAARCEAPVVDDLATDAGPIAVAADEPEGESRCEWAGGPIRVAVIGRPNVGKSSLINRLLGEERMLAHDAPGTTRDSVDTELRAVVEGGEQVFVLVDTAGIRRKRSIAERLERFAIVSALRSIDRADVVLLVLDGVARPSDQDAKVGSLADQAGKGIIVVANKWDLIENPEWREQFPKAVAHDLTFLRHAPFLRVSAKTGRGVSRLLEPIVAVQRERHRRIGTGALNRFFAEVAERHPPPVFKGKRSRLYFASQPLVRPPTFIFTASNASHVPPAYARYLANQLRERFGFGGTPIWLKFRARQRPKG